MRLPPEIDERIRRRFEYLSEIAEKLLQEMEQEDRIQRTRDRQRNVVNLGEYSHCEDAFASLKTQVLSLLQLLSAGDENIRKLSDEVRGLESKISQAKVLKGIINGLRDDYEAGMLEHLADLIVANVTADYLRQAEALLQDRQTGEFAHIPSAVLAGAVLEDGLRRLCQRQTPPIPVTKANGELKTLNPLIDDLKQASVFNELKAKQLRAWAGIRNAAAHGQFDEFTRSDVEQMLAGIQDFLADYL